MFRKDGRPSQFLAFWEDQGVKDLNGVVWYRKEIDVPASMVGKPARVYLGRIIDADVLYINGKQVGRTGSLYSERRYNIPADLLKAGKNIFVARITNNNGKGDLFRINLITYLPAAILLVLWDIGNIK